MKEIVKQQDLNGKYRECNPSFQLQIIHSKQKFKKGSVSKNKLNIFSDGK